MMHARFRLAAIAVTTGLMIGGAQANEFEKPIREFAKSNVTPWLSSPEVVEAIKAQNVTNASLTEADILKLDKQWRAETSASAKPLIQSVSGNKLSAFLVAKKKESGDLITELFIMDDKGLNVAVSDTTSDYWQGDEAKWQKSFGAGPGALHIDEAERDESTQLMQSQASLPIEDPQTGKVIGAITVGVNLDAL